MVRNEKEEPDWTEQVGRVVGLWLDDAGGKRKAVGEIIRVTPKLFTVDVKGEERVVRFQRQRTFASSDGIRMEFGHRSRTNPSMCYKSPLPED
jgi:hypothetical protein